jgi:sialic acid synthase SpsE
VKIGDFDTSAKVLVVAEIGNNHEGDVGRAREMVHAAADSGAGAAKFQTFDTDHYVGRADRARYERLKSFELSHDEFAELSELARSLDLLFISTPFDLASAAFLAEVADALKVASGDNSFYPLLNAVGGAGKPVIFSTGLSDLSQVRRTLGALADAGARDVAVLHCVASYPVPPEQAALRAIPRLRDELAQYETQNDSVRLEIGYSDHVIGIEAAMLSAALGARIVEKHFTLEGIESDFRDHELSATPPQLRELVDAIDRAHEMLGDFEKTIQPAESANVSALRRSIVAAADLPQGHVLRLEDITWIRPSGPLAPGDEDQVVGRRLRHPVVFGQQLAPDDLEG